MPKYFVKPENINKNIIDMKGESAAHLVVVLRAKIGDRVLVCDGQRNDYECEIVLINGRDSLTLKILSQSTSPEPKADVVLYQALPKGDKFELIVQKCVELGINRIVPIFTQNSEMPTLTNTKLERYMKIAESAAKQSLRGIIPQVTPPLTLQQSIDDAKNLSLTFAPFENEEEVGLKDFLQKQNLPRYKSIGYFIGSEGGFSGPEIMMFRVNKIQTVSLGGRIMRTETAGLAVLAILMYELEELGGI
jgi:16S rRNA (uracil1498-N3)-methyltransferase